MKNNVRVRKAIQRAIYALDRELGLKSLPRSGAMSNDQLRKFRATLARMLCDIDCNTIADQPYDGGLGRVIIDSWPFDSSLGEIILEAEQDYLEFKSRI